MRPPIRRCWLVVLLLLAVGPPLVGSAAAASRPANAASGVPYFDLVVDPGRPRLYGSDFAGGYVHVVSSTTQEVLASVQVGRGPAGIDLSPDGRELAVALFGAGQIAFLDLETLTVTDRLTPLVTVGPYRPWDVLYGRPGRLYSVGNPGSEGFDYVHVFDTSNRAELGRSSDIIRATPRLALTADKNTLFVAEPGFSPMQIYNFDVRTDTPLRVAKGPHGPVLARTLAVLPDGSRVYTSGGQVWPPTLTAPVGNFAAVTAEIMSGSQIEYVPFRGRLYVTSGPRVYEVDASTYDVLRSHQTTSTPGVARASADGSTLYISTDAGIELWQIGGSVHRTFLPASPRG